MRDESIEKWSDEDADPVGDLLRAKKMIESQVGYTPPYPSLYEAVVERIKNNKE